MVISFSIVSLRESSVLAGMMLMFVVPLPSSSISSASVETSFQPGAASERSGADSTSRAKTLFIDNPFGAAKDIYIWEPIFSLLAENNCQLIVPARGATPEITGKFDINYVLGQQMTGNRTTTVVVNYTSKTKGEELEYRDLDYQQQTFDFI
jgi:hypothetical protein